MAEQPASPGTVTSALDLLQTVRTLRAAGGALLAQLTLHAQLAQVEWAEEKRRLGRVLVTALLCVAFLQCFLLLLAALVLGLSWDTPYRLPAALAVILFFAVGCALTGRRLQLLVASGQHSFAATHAELAADLALLRKSL